MGRTKKANVIYRTQTVVRDDYYRQEGAGTCLQPIAAKKLRHKTENPVRRGGVAVAMAMASDFAEKDKSVRRETA